jgi:hypothetical protein
MRSIVGLVAAAIAAVFVEAGARAQNLSPADVAAKLSGTWVLNPGLSKGFSAPGRRGRARLRAVDTDRRFGGQAGGARFAMAAMVPQRGGGGGGVSDASDLTPEQRAEQAAMRQVQQIAAEITIKASADSVTFNDARGERTYAIDDKATKVDVGGSPLTVKSKWDKSVLKQEFSNSQAKLTETWSVDDSGHLVLTAKVESMTLRTPEQRAVFDRK